MSDAIVLPSGKVLRANGGIVGINAELEIYEGYDAGIPYPLPAWETDPDFAAIYLSNDEAYELADIMIERWLAFRAGVPL